MFLAQEGRNLCKNAGSCRKAGLCGNGCIMPCRSCKKGLCNAVCPDYAPVPCPLLEKPPYCCNECGRRYGFGCDHEYRFYDPNLADDMARMRKVESREGIDITPEQLMKMNALVTPLIKKGQSPEHIWATHAGDLPVTFRTYYNYVNKGIMDVIRLDLPKAVRFKSRKKAKKDGEKVERCNMIGHLYSDFEALPDEKRAKAVQMDCVEGKQTEKEAILTLTWPPSTFQLPIFLEEEDQETVQEVFYMLQDLLGPKFDEIFEIVLTDRGASFLDASKLEYDRKGVKRCSIYYCDPQHPDQKPECERQHAELRRILPKGTSLAKFTKKDMALIASHMNSYRKPELNYDTPIARVLKVIPKKLLDAFSVGLIPPDDVIMKPDLIKDILDR